MRDRTGGSQKGLLLMRYRWFESISLQRRVSNEPRAVTGYGRRRSLHSQSVEGAGGIAPVELLGIEPIDAKPRSNNASTTGPWVISIATPMTSDVAPVRAINQSHSSSIPAPPCATARCSSRRHRTTSVSCYPLGHFTAAAAGRHAARIDGIMRRSSLYTRLRLAATQWPAYFRRLLQHFPKNCNFR